MKVIITESQALNIIREGLEGDEMSPELKSYYRQHEKILNYLLDKISKEGKDSLTPEEQDILTKLSYGQEIDLGGDEETADSPEDFEGQKSGEYEVDDFKDEGYPGASIYNDMFMERFPDHYEFYVDSDKFTVTKHFDEHVGMNVLLVESGDIAIIIVPFKTPNSFEATIGLNTTQFETTRTPEEPADMVRLIDRFLKTDLKGIVKVLTKKR